MHTKTSNEYLNVAILNLTPKKTWLPCVATLNGGDRFVNTRLKPKWIFQEPVYFTEKKN